MNALRELKHAIRDPALAARAALLLFAVIVVILHLLPRPLLTTAAPVARQIPYDPTLNFMSELVRTQYGPLMTFNFLLMAAASVAVAYAARSRRFFREAGFLALSGLCSVCLAIFPVDLTDFAKPGNACDAVDRIEPCTWVGAIHNPLSSILFMCLGFAWLSLALRRDRRWAPAVRSGVVCFFIALVLLAINAAYRAYALKTGHYWIGLMQRSVALSALAWVWSLAGALRVGSGMPAEPQC